MAGEYSAGAAGEPSIKRYLFIGEVDGSRLFETQALLRAARILLMESVILHGSDEVRSNNVVVSRSLGAIAQ